MEWGIRPEAMIGHSLGEYVAACLSGVFSLEDALALVAARGRMMQPLVGGAMLAVPLSETELQPWLNGSVSLAAINGPSQTVLSGPVEALEELAEQLAEEGVGARRLPTNYGFHSQMMDSILGQFAEEVKRTPRHRPQLPYVSNLTGTWITEAEATDPAYWAQHLRRTVRFADGLREVFKKSERQQLLEVGPGHTLSRMARRHPSATSKRAALASLPAPDDSLAEAAYMLTTLGRLWLAGVSVDWRGFHTHERRRRLPLPTYPFERRRYWIEAGKPERRSTVTGRPGEMLEGEAVGPTPAPLVAHHDQRPQTLRTPYVAPSTELERSVAHIWQEILGIAPIGIDDNFFDLGGDSLIATQAMARLKRELGMEIPVVSLYEGVTIRYLTELVRAEQNGEEGTQALACAGDTREERVSRRKHYQQQQRLKKYRSGDEARLL
jgi:acyl transferase domain-containing protein